MGKIYKSGRGVIVTAGRFAGKKAVVAKSFDEGSKARPFAHCLVLGVQKAPLKITNGMSKKKLQKRMRVKPFVKYINQTHLMPTRYQLPAEMEPKSWVNDSSMDSQEGRQTAKKTIAGVLKEKFKNTNADKA